MSIDIPSASAKTAAAKTLATKPITENIDNLNKILPTVVETSEMSLAVPTKLVVNERTLIIVGVLGGMALGAGIVYGINKLRERKVAQKVKKAVEETAEIVNLAHNPKS